MKSAHRSVMFYIGQKELVMQRKMSMVAGQYRQKCEAMQEKFMEQLQKMQSQCQKWAKKCEMLEQENESLSKDKQELQEKYSEKSRSYVHTYWFHFLRRTVLILGTHVLFFLTTYVADRRES